MIWIGCVVLSIYGGLMWIARGEQAPEGLGVLFEPFYKIALWIYKKLSLRFPGILGTAMVERDLGSLHPGEALEALKTEYYVKKLALSLAVLVVGILLGMAATVGRTGEEVLGAEGVLPRRDYREGLWEVTLTAEYGQKRYDFLVEVEPKRLTEEAAEEMFEQLYQELPGYILGDNESLDAVSGDLILEESYDGAPAELEWSSSRPDIVSKSGRVSRVEEAVEVVLTVGMSYEEYSCEKTFTVTVVPSPITSEGLYLELEEMLRQSQEESLEQEFWKLPTHWREQEIRWMQRVEDNGPIIGLVALVAAVLLFGCADRDLHEQVERRKKQLQRDYPELVHKLVLFVGAGMTIRGAFCKVAGDYEQKVRPRRILPAYEEMLYTCRELRAGISEGAAYERFGKRTGLAEYIRLSAMLTQNLKRGNSSLLERLRREAACAGEERLQRCKKLGEEAGTKLLVPMVLLLAVVMVMVMIPAFAGL